MSVAYLKKKEEGHTAASVKVWKQTTREDVIHGLDCFVRRLTDIGPSSSVRFIPHGSDEFRRAADKYTPPGVPA